MNFLPLSPQPPSPPGKGEIFSFLMQGASPLASPELNPSGAGAMAAYHAPMGGLPRCCRITLPSLSPTRGRGGFGRRLSLPHHEFLSPIPPTRARRALFPRGEGGDFWFISPGATAPGTPAPEPGRHRSRGGVSRADGGRGHGGGGLPWGERERRTASAIHSGKVLGGLGASFKKPPNASLPWCPAGTVCHGASTNARLHQ